MEEYVNQHKPCALNVKFDVCASSRGLNIPWQGYKRIAGVITKLIPILGELNKPMQTHSSRTLDETEVLLKFDIQILIAPLKSNVLITTSEHVYSENLYTKTNHAYLC